jgi:hypothetical protein
MYGLKPVPTFPDLKTEFFNSLLGMQLWVREQLRFYQ